VLTRSVRDSAATLDATMGVDIGDPYCAPLPKRPFKKEIGKDPGRLRVAYWSKTLRGQTIDEDCQKALLDSVKLCSELGHDLIEMSPKLDGRQLGRAFTVIWAASCAFNVERIALITGQKPSADQYEPLTWELYEMGIKVNGADYLLAVQTLQSISREVASFFTDYDIFLTPTLGEPPALLGTFDSPADDPLKGWRRSGPFAPFTPICNATGQPAMSVPLYWNEEGLPIGTHFMGRFGDEATLFRLAAQLEKARPWKNRRPPVSD